jgi:hypothetical protein
MTGLLSLYHLPPRDRIPAHTNRHADQLSPCLSTFRRSIGNPGARQPRLQVYAVVVLCCLPWDCYAASTKVVYGTVAVVILKKNQAVLAADSRAIQTTIGIDTATNDTEVKDNACKVTTSNGKFAFVQAGVGGDSEWDGFEAARSIAARFISSAGQVTERTIDLIRESWIASAMEWANRAKGSTLLDIASHLKGNAIITAVFVVVTSAGQIKCQVATLTVAPALNGKVNARWAWNPVKTPEEDGRSTDIVIGQADVWRSRLSTNLPTYWANELRQWEEIRRIDHTVQARHKAQRIVELTMDHHTATNTVGGNVNAVELTSSGTEWITDHPECRDK